MGVSNMTLVKIAAIGGICTVSMGMAWRFKINSNIAKSQPYQEALKTVRAHRGAVEVLGEPIRDKLINIGDTDKNYTRDLSARYEVPVSGSKQRGTVYFWANRKDVSEPWVVTRIELGLKKEPDRRLLIKNVNGDKQQLQ